MDNNEKPRAMTSVADEGGAMGVLGNDGEICALMGVSEEGGLVTVLGNDEKARANMGVNEYGNGVVETRDNDGYKTGNLP